MTSYAVAQYCRNGHEITADLGHNPGKAAKFCPECGASTLSACEQCRTPLRGLLIGGYGMVRETPRPNHCHECGGAMPWVAEKLGAARELVAMMGELSADEKEQLNKSLEDIVQAGPRTELGVFRFKALVGKVRQASQKFLYDVAIDVASETAKKLLVG